MSGYASLPRSYATAERQGPSGIKWTTTSAGVHGLDGGDEYYRHICKTPLLSNEQEYDLATRGCGPNADPLARQQLVEANLRLATAFVTRYLNGRAGIGSLTADDLVQEANIGILRATHGFDPARGFKFSTYATWWMRQAVERAITDKSAIIRTPVYVQTQAHRANRVSESMESDLGRAPTTDELLAVGVSAQALHYLNAPPQVVSYDRPIQLDSDDGDTLAGKLEDQSELGDVTGFIETADMAQRMAALMRRLLTAREYRVLRLRYGMDSADGDAWPLERIGKRLGVTRERVRQIEAKALTKLRCSNVGLQSDGSIVPPATSASSAQASSAQASSAQASSAQASSAQASSASASRAPASRAPARGGPHAATRA